MRDIVGMLDIEGGGARHGAYPRYRGWVLDIAGMLDTSVGITASIYLILYVENSSQSVRSLRWQHSDVTCGLRRKPTLTAPFTLPAQRTHLLIP